jgi:aerobic-type carbon monoxide dehydrogenase small subunit (CoxS/CutS family)
MGISLTVNGTPVEVCVDGTTSLILAMRNELGLKGTRFGCGGEDCGACNGARRRRDNTCRRSRFLSAGECHVRPNQSL